MAAQTKNVSPCEQTQVCMRSGSTILPILDPVLRHFGFQFGVLFVVGEE